MPAPRCFSRSRHSSASRSCSDHETRCFSLFCKERLASRLRALLGGAPACFALLAEAADSFAEADGEGGDGFQALLAALREPAVIFAADFREQELSVAQDSGERIVHLVAEKLSERFPVQNIFCACKLLRVAGHLLRLAQAPVHQLQRSGAATAGAREEA